MSREVWMEHLERQGIEPARLVLAEELVAFAGALMEQERRALVAVVLVSMEVVMEGSSFVPMREYGVAAELDGFLVRRLGEVIPKALRETKGWRAAELVEVFEELVREGKAKEVVGRPGEFKPLIVTGDGRLYHQRVFRAERGLEGALNRHLGGAKKMAKNGSDAGPRDPQEGDITSYLEDVLDRPTMVGGEAMELNEEQKRAAMMALKSPISVITGGPGTGKTSIVVAMLRMLVRQGVAPGRIALAAPTGKAANRMAESIGVQLRSIEVPRPEDRALMEARLMPKTLHRLLGMSPRVKGFLHNKKRKLPYEVVIVDEASMIDLFLMEGLVDALSSRTRLVLLGDAEQLPSVELGAVLRDLLPGEEAKGENGIAAVELRRSYRMDRGTAAGQEIYQLAQDIRAGERWVFAKEGLFDAQVPKWGPVVREPGRLKWKGVEWLEPHRDRFGRPQLYDFLDAYYERHLAPVMRISPFVEAVDDVLSAGEARQVEAISEGLQRHRILTLTRVFETGSQVLNGVLHQKVLRQRGQGVDFAYAPGEPVMILRNDYEKGLFNGDQGVVLMAGGRPVVAFGGREGFRLFPLAGVAQNMEHSFAMTVHKAQGSEFDGVALVLPGEELPLLTREILYTGVTRAKEWALVVGDRRLFMAGVGRRAERFTAISVDLFDQVGGEKSGEKWG